MNDRTRLRRDYALLDQRNRQDVLGAQDGLILVHPDQLAMWDDLPNSRRAEVHRRVQCDLFGTCDQGRD